MSEDKALVHRLNRIVGQIQGISNRIESCEQKDCLETLQQLKASINALKKFGEAYVTQHMQECMAKEKDAKNMQMELAKVVKSVFSI